MRAPAEPGLKILSGLCGWTGEKERKRPNLRDRLQAKEVLRRTPAPTGLPLTLINRYGTYKCGGEQREPHRRPDHFSSLTPVFDCTNSKSAPGASSTTFRPLGVTSNTPRSVMMRST